MSSGGHNIGNSVIRVECLGFRALAAYPPQAMHLEFNNWDSVGLGFRAALRVSKNQMERAVENEVGTGILRRLKKDYDFHE